MAKEATRRKLEQAHEKLEEAEQLLHCQVKELQEGQGQAKQCGSPTQCPSAQLATLIALVQSARETLEMLQHEEAE